MTARHGLGTAVLGIVVLRDMTAMAVEPPAGVRPNILFCIADDWGWPHAGAYGDAVVRTPTFDRLAREGVLFANAVGTAPSCTPCRNAILTAKDNDDVRPCHAHCHHDVRGVCISPDMIWLLICQGVVNHVNANAARRRPRFVAHQGKVKILV